MLNRMPVLLVMILLIALVGCGSENAEQAAVAQSEAAPTHDHGDEAHSHDDAMTGTLLETMDSGGYTYMKLDTAEGEIWVAGPITAVTVGDKVEVAGQMLMKNFHATSLDRDFEEIWFVSEVLTNDAMLKPKSDDMIKSTHSNMAVDKSEMDFSDVKPVDNGVTVQGIYARMNELDGQMLTVNAKVVKFTPNIMGRNWVHVQDGTGGADDHDLTVTTDAVVEVGDLVLLQGKLAVDKDFGSGYVYKVILEETKVMVQ
jgi:hypothetical protein